jgi:tetratricopeptide (TPR) repeat protein
MDSAAVRLATPVVDAATRDTLPIDRYKRYGSQRDPVYIDGHFDGWHWYVWRARAEVALELRRWDAAAEAARHCVIARPLAAQDWLLLAVTEGRAGHDDAAREAARRAATLDPSLPEALYLDGLWDWRSGRRLDAQNAFRAAVGADRTFELPALALVRSRLPGSAPDSLPVRFLNGRREAAMITSPVGPKIEQFVQLEKAVAIMTKLDPVVPDSLKKGLFGVQIPLWVLVDENGRPVISEIGWTKPGAFAPQVLADLSDKLHYWTFSPAQMHGAPHAVWVDILYQFAL